MNNGYQCGFEELSESNLSMEYKEMSKVVFESRIATSSEYNPCLNSALEYTVANENISNEELRNIDVDNEEEWKRMKRKKETIAEKRRIHNEKMRSRYQEMPDDKRQAYIRRRERENAAKKAKYHAMTPEERRSHYAKKRKKLDNAARERLNAAHRARYQAMTPEERTIFNRKMRIGSREKGNASRRTKYHAMTPEERRIRNAKNRKKLTTNDEDKKRNVSEIQSQDEKEMCNQKPQEHIDGHPQSVETEESRTRNNVFTEDQEKKLEEGNSITGVDMDQHLQEKDSVEELGRRRNIEFSIGFLAKMVIQRHEESKIDGACPETSEKAQQFSEEPLNVSVGTVLRRRIREERKKQAAIEKLERRRKREMGKLLGEVREEPCVTEKTTSTIVRNLVSAMNKEQHLEELERKRKSEDPLGVFAEMEMEVMRQLEGAKKRIAGPETSGRAQELSEESSIALVHISSTPTIQGASDFSDKLQRYIAAKERQKAAQRAKYKAMTPEERTIFNRKMRRGRTEKENAARRAKYQAMTPEERHSSNTKYRKTREERRIYNEKARMRYARNRKKSTINDEDKERNVSAVESQEPREHIDGHPQSVETEESRTRNKDFTEDQEKKLEEEGPSKELVDNGQLLPTPTKPRQNILENEKYIEAIRARLQAMTRKERRIFIRKRTQEHIDYHQNEISNLKKTEEIRTQDKSLTSNKKKEHDPLNSLGVTSEMQKEVIQQSMKAKDHQEEEQTLMETLNVAEPYSDDLTSNVLPKTSAKSKPNLDKGQLAQRERERKDTANAAQRARYQAMTPEERRTAEERRIHNEKARMKYQVVKDVRKEQRKNNERAIARYEQHKAELKAKYQAMSKEERRNRYAKNRKKPIIEDEYKKRNVTNIRSQNDKEICNEKPQEHVDHHPDEQLQPEKMIDATTQEKTAANKFRLCCFFPLAISYDN
ncbi:unnamed protein product [Caenorhabditis brenneri]